MFFSRRLWDWFAPKDLVWPLSLRSRRQNRQGLWRFPFLVAPILLTAHHSPNVWDGKRHAWREKDTAIEAAIDQGRDLVGALAKHYGISKGLVRSPLYRQRVSVPALTRQAELNPDGPLHLPQVV